ncbi:MAG TPA: tRNA preQ1(34) S-adenosylmethionine ribosyltransferase-isomerase QueA [Bacillota bacterium]|nr:tRNA preQ1(34) S-adenosylmethionine ribosyltransferase-isomerase QueA [Bacillota bacterium]
MKVSDFNYRLPEELIGQTPIEKRDESRLLVYDKSKRKPEHKVFKDISQYLRKGDCLVINDTKVIPARLLGKRENTGGAMEFVLLSSIEKNMWRVLVKPGKRARIGTRFVFANGDLRAEIISKTQEGGRIVRFYYDGIFEELLDRAGIMPLPPYIHAELKDKNRYQTVYAQHDGSAAAPTAGLHFTPDLLKQIEAMGVNVAKITLHVGIGTFRPVKTESLEEHKMHEEAYQVDQRAADIINNTRKRGSRVIAVGTTSLRTIESVADDRGYVRAGSGVTDIFIYPGYRFKATDALITNFHLPKSTLLMLVSALVGREEIQKIYKEAIDKGYSFFSFGDAMFLY